MSLATLHDRARGLGLGLLYERHWAAGFRGLFDHTSAEWPATAVALKVVDLRAFESAGVTVEELIGHYRQTLPRDGGVGGRVPDGLAAAVRAYREAGYSPPVPPDLAVDGPGRAV